MLLKYATPIIFKTCVPCCLLFIPFVYLSRGLFVVVFLFASALTQKTVTLHVSG